MEEEIQRQTLYELLHRSAARFPDKLAMVYEDRRITYRQWLQEVDAVAEVFRQAGLQRGETLSIYGRNSLDYGSVIFAAARLGLVLVPVNYMLSSAETAYIFDHAQIQAVVSSPEFFNTVRQALQVFPVGRDPVMQFAMDVQEKDSEWPNIHDTPSHLLVGESSHGANSLDLAQILYTSGTESRPKGVMLTHENLISEYVSAIIDGGFTAQDIVLHALPFYHSAQQHVFLGPYVYLGATHVVTSSPKADNILSLLEQERVTEFFAPPTVWISLLRSPRFDNTDLSQLIKGHYGAAIMPREVLMELRRRLPHTRFWNFYGQTEVAPLATVLGPEDQFTKLGSCGKAGLNVETVLLDDDNQVVPPGQIGEICHRTPHAMQGYFRDPEKTALAFAGGWFHSGDLGVFDADGYLTVVDRKKDMIKTGGENVASREVEEVLYQAPEVSEVAVFGVPDPYWMEKVVAVVVAKAGTHPDPNALMAFCFQRLAHYKVPKVIVVQSELPKNPSGKILKRQLRDAWI
jgi:fatty-acyl-CoA synthase